MRLRNLRRVKTEEKLCDDKLQENSEGSAEKVFILFGLLLYNYKNKHR